MWDFKAARLQKALGLGSAETQLRTAAAPPPEPLMGIFLDAADEKQRYESFN